MNTTAITWLSQQIAWEARLSELRDRGVRANNPKVANDSGIRKAA